MTQFINYSHSLPVETSSSDHPDNIMNLPAGYPFNELNGYKRPQLLDVLKKYVTGELPNSFPLQPRNIFNCVPQMIYSADDRHDADGNELPVYAISHLFRHPYSFYGPDYVAIASCYYYTHWVPGRVRTIKKNGQVVGEWQKFTYSFQRREDDWKRKPVRFILELYSLPQNEYPEYQGERPKHKYGNWMLCKLYGTKM